MKRSAAFVLSLLLGLVAVLKAQAEDTLAKVKRTGVLVAGVREDAPPFSFQEKGSNATTGYDVDLVTALATRLGAKAELRPLSAADRLSELVLGNVDLLAANLTQSPNLTRESVIDLSEPYLATGQKFLAKRGSLATLKDLRGKRIGALAGTSSEGCARNRCAGGKIVPFEDYLQGIGALRTGEIDAFTTDEVILVALLSSLPKGEFEIPKLQVAEEQYHLGVRKGDKSFLAFVNKAIREMQQSGEANELKKKWFEVQEVSIPAAYSSVSAAYGAVVRKASVRGRLLALRLKGILHPNAEVSIFALDGTYVGRGTIVGISEDDFYLDVDDAQYDLVRPGFLVAMNMSNEAAMDVAVRHQALLTGVEADSDKEAERLQAGAEKEGLAKQQRAQEIDLLRERSRLSVEEERALFFRGWR